MKKKKELVIKEPKVITIRPDNSPANMIREAISGKASLEQLKGFLELQREYEANEARKAFALSFAAAQSKIVAVTKTKINPQTHSKYADLGDILISANPIYTQEGFSVIFYEGETTLPGHIRICADILHRAGHKETYHYDIPLDGVGIQGNPNMTKIHGKSSSVSYGRRYLMCMIWNIPTQDNDGNMAGTLPSVVDFIDNKQKNQIVDMLADKEIPIPQFLTYMKIDNLDVMPKAKFSQAVIAIQSRKKTVKK